MTHTQGGFTIPGESGYEALTLRLAQKWGADCIRDSDGTQLSEAILLSGIPIYSTICIVRSINDWAKRNPDKLQRNFLMSAPVAAEGGTVAIKPLKGYFREQFTLCPSDDPREFWQVFDRTTGKEHPLDQWEYDPQTETVTVKNAQHAHLYTVNFLATRVWEEISMYNHITNDWGDRERLMAVEPRYPETQKALLSFYKDWCETHPATKVVRFTSLFYNFCWIWGAEDKKRNVYTDWGSYDFTANPVSLREFVKQYGYKMTSEDFVNMGRHNPVHNPPTRKMKDWMAFTGAFVRAFGKQLVDITHAYGKLAYVFYDDTWIGLEPWNGHFAEFGFDGLIKCVFNAFEARLNAGVTGVKTHELRLHPYLFPTGLTGEATFAPGGHPEADARRYWACVRRALLRVKIDRIGLGGYLHLVEPFPAFQDAIAGIADEFRMLKRFHEQGKPWESGVRVGVLHSWGALRTWNCSGHMHEHPELPLNHLYEAMAGLPISLRALSFDEVIENGVPDDIDVVLNAGRAGDAWSGGDIWQNARLQAAIQAFALAGGGVIGVGEPAAARGGMRYFQIADILGVDREIGGTICFGKYAFTPDNAHFITRDACETLSFHNHTGGVYALSGDTKVLRADGNDVALAAHAFGNGRGVYLSGFTYSSENARLLYRALLWACRKEEAGRFYLPDDPRLECAYFPGANALVVINNADCPIDGTIPTPIGDVSVSVDKQGIAVLNA